MRVLTVVLALVAIPFVAGVSQAPQQDPKNCGLHLTAAEKANALGARAGAVLVHGGKHGVMDSPCGSDDSAAPDCPVSSTVPAGSLSIVGMVKDADTFVGLANWCIQLFTESGTATAVTDGSGNYAFRNLPDVTYLICEVWQSGWEQTFPTAANGVPCPTGFGHSFPMWGFDASHVDFKNRKL